MSLIVCFDLGDTLVIPQQPDEGPLLSLNVLPLVVSVPHKLERTKSNKMELRLEDVCNTGTRLRA